MMGVLGLLVHAQLDGKPFIFFEPVLVCTTKPLPRGRGELDVFLPLAIAECCWYGNRFLCGPYISVLLYTVLLLSHALKALFSQEKDDCCRRSRRRSVTRVALLGMRFLILSVMLFARKTTKRRP